MADVYIARLALVDGNTRRQISLAPLDASPRVFGSIGTPATLSVSGLSGPSGVPLDGDRWIILDRDDGSERYSFLGVDGKWVLQATTDVPSPTPPSIIASNIYGGVDNESIQIDGIGLDEFQVPLPVVFAFWPMRTNFGDIFDNFDQIVPTNSPLLSSFGPRLMLRLDSASSQFVTSPVGGAGEYTLLGLFSSAGDRIFTFGIKAVLDDVVPAWIAWGGVEEMFVGFRVVGENVEYVQHVMGEEAVLRSGLEVRKLAVFALLVERDDVTNTLTFTHVDEDGNESRVSTDIFPPRLRMLQAPSGATIGLDFGRGFDLAASAPQGARFTRASVHENYTVLAPGNRLQKSASAYRTGLVRAEPRSSGLFYFEILNGNTFDLQFGVAPAWSDLTAPPGVVGWAMNTINGRKFTRQTGGGTPWSGDGAIAAGSVIGVLVDTGAGSMEVFVDGVSRGQPHPAGTIVGTVLPMAGSGGSSGTAANDFTIRMESASWTEAPGVGESQWPGLPFALGPAVHMDGWIFDAVMRNDIMAGSDRKAFMDTREDLKAIFRSPGGKEIDGSAWITRRSLLGSITALPGGGGNPGNPGGGSGGESLPTANSSLIMSIPGTVPLGDHEFLVSLNGVESNSIPLTVRRQEVVANPFVIDFSSRFFEAATFARQWMAGHKQWGGANGGIVRENVVLDRAAGVMSAVALGDLHSGPVKGVDRFGNPSGFDTRIGAAIVSRQYFGPGRFTVRVRLPALVGCAPAMWLFHYEENVSGSPHFDEMGDDGIHTQGSQPVGFWRVRNHEIDIEMISNLKTDPDPMTGIGFANGRFNGWRGELRAQLPNTLDPVWSPFHAPQDDPGFWTEFHDKWVAHGVDIADGNFHDFTMDWKTDPAGIDFLIDGNLIVSVDETVPDIPARLWIGVWFPSAAGNFWAGDENGQALWESQRMDIRRIEYVPNGDPVRNIGESFPIDVFRDIPGLSATPVDARTVKLHARMTDDDRVAFATVDPTPRAFLSRLTCKESSLGS